MPIHDWSKVEAGVFHDFHQAWLGDLRRALNQSVLPKSYYAMIEQRAGRIEADLLTLHASRDPVTDDSSGGLALLEIPPEVDIVERADDAWYSLKQSSLVIREVHGDRVIALLEIVSPGNKSTEYALERFVDKVAGALMQGIHVVVIDLHPPGKWDASGIHHAIWEAIGQSGYTLPHDKPLTLASYTGMPETAAYIKAAAVGDTLARLPLFLDVSRYVRLPLEETYQSTYAAAPLVWQKRIEE